MLFDETSGRLIGISSGITDNFQLSQANIGSIRKGEGISIFDLIKDLEQKKLMDDAKEKFVEAVLDLTHFPQLVVRDEDSNEEQYEDQ